MSATISPSRRDGHPARQLAIGHVRYSTAGSKGATAIRDVQPFFGEFSMGGCAIAHNGNLTNAAALRRELIERGSIFQSSSTANASST
jgi:amidophosphoribosyltransferase